MADLKWWQKAVFYQIYPRSFADGNGDGVGDFWGMIERLDYLAGLGIDALWLSPHYPSPQFDVGYDVADYSDVNPEYGSLEDFKRFLDGAHQRGIRVILDLVLNHTSDQHAWFIESKSRRDNPKRDWYIWKDGKGGSPPNNWNSGFGGSAWEYDETTGQYYYHYFFKEQPDLNWRNPEVRKALWDEVRFWLDMGVDGFRLDAIGTIFEDPEFPDHSVKESLFEIQRAWFMIQDPAEREQLEEKFQAMFKYQVDLPEVVELMKELRSVIDEYDDRVLVGETDRIEYYGDGTDILHLLFNFPLMQTDHLTPEWVLANQKQRYAEMPPAAWPCNTLGNHDSPRVISRFSDGKSDHALARIYPALILTLRGTPFLYNGEEIGMTDLVLDDSNQFRDNLSPWIYRTLITEMGMPPDEAVLYASRFGRDKCRTPMHWVNTSNAGFSPAGVTTWLPVNPEYAEGINVADQDRDPLSLLNHYRSLLRLRKRTPALVEGDFVPIKIRAKGVLVYLRKINRPPINGNPAPKDCLVVLNLSDQTHTLHLKLDSEVALCLFSSRRREGRQQKLANLKIAPFEIYIAELV